MSYLFCSLSLYLCKATISTEKLFHFRPNLNLCFYDSKHTRIVYWYNLMHLKWICSVVKMESSLSIANTFSLDCNFKNAISLAFFVDQPCVCAVWFVCQQLPAQKFKTSKMNVTIENVNTMASCELNNKIALLSEVVWISNMIHFLRWSQ